MSGFEMQRNGARANTCHQPADSCQRLGPSGKRLASNKLALATSPCSSQQSDMTDTRTIPLRTSDLAEAVNTGRPSTGCGPTLRKSPSAEWPPERGVVELSVSGSSAPCAAWCYICRSRSRIERPGCPSLDLLEPRSDTRRARSRERCACLCSTGLLHVPCQHRLSILRSSRIARRL